MPRFTSLVSAVLFSAAFLTLPLTFAQGPIDPPGTPAPTMKTLDEISAQIAASAGAVRTPVNSLAGSGSAVHVISQPGSYYLTGHVTGITGRAGIQITASNVTLDLNGFSVVGTTGGADGIVVTGDQMNIAVKNGVVRDWPLRGVNFEFADNVIVRDLRVEGNTGIGLLAGDRAIVSGCVATANLVGIQAGAYSVISQCVVTNNTSHGIAASFGATISNSTIAESGGDGIRADVGSNISHCTVRQTTIVGIRLQNTISTTREGASVVANCTLVRNGTGGGVNSGAILSEGMALIQNNTITDNRQSVNTFAIQAENAGTRIDGNLIAECEKAIVLTDSGNLVVRNTFHNCDTLLDNTGTNSVAPTTSDLTSAFADNAFANVSY